MRRRSHEQGDSRIEGGGVAPPDGVRFHRDPCHIEWFRTQDGSAHDGRPEDRLLGSETQRIVRETLETLPPMQAEVIRLRDVQGWGSAEVCNALDISETNQRVLLHRARSKVRRALESYLGRTVP